CVEETAYVMDEMYDKMEAEEDAICVCYAGDSLTMNDNYPNLNFVIPKRGAHLFVDSICIPASSGAPELGEMYINFLSEPEIALANIEFINYASPNDGAIAIMSTEIKNNTKKNYNT
ncbi:extracellular solute-binding protein, partial [Brachyspira hyodysenteriae]|uniref:extracellular solute-binding protein n=1 Tax=Brachyspira hyodysenteriae TaxID=159 RepID=UPI001F53DEF7